MRFTTQVSQLVFVLLVGAAAVFGQPTQAQAQVSGKIFVLCEGGGGSQGALAVVDFQGDLANAAYRHLDSIPSFSSSLYLHDSLLFVARADGRVDVYNARTEARIDTFSHPGVRQFAVYNNQLLVTSFQQPYFAAYDLTGGYSQLYSLDSTRLTGRTQDIVLKGDTAYVAVIGAFGVGPSNVVELDLQNRDTLRTLQTDLNPTNLHYSALSNRLYVGCSKDFSTGGSLQVFELGNPTDTANRTDSSVYYASNFTAGPDYLYMTVQDTGFGNNALARQSLALDVVDTNWLPGSFYGVRYLDTLNALLVSRTDFVSTGYLQLVDNLQGTPALGTDSLATHTSPRDFVFWTPQAPDSTVSRPAANQLQLELYPNPASTYAVVQASQALSLELLNLQGQVLRRLALQPGQAAQLDLQDLPEGVYLLRDPQGRSVARRLLIRR